MRANEFPKSFYKIILNTLFNVSPIPKKEIYSVINTFKKKYPNDCLTFYLRYQSLTKSFDSNYWRECNLCLNKSQNFDSTLSRIYAAFFYLENNELNEFNSILNQYKNKQNHNLGNSFYKNNEKEVYEYLEMRCLLKSGQYLKLINNLRIINSNHFLGIESTKRIDKTDFKAIIERLYYDNKMGKNFEKFYMDQIISLLNQD